MKKTIIAITAALLLTTSPVFPAQNVPQLNPFEEIQKLQQDMDQIFQKFHQKFLEDATFAKFNSSFPISPAVDLKDTGNNYIIKADIAGADAKSIKITHKDDMLKIEAQTIKEEKKQSENFIKKERFVGKFVRIISLPKDADAEHLKTDYKNGVLKIMIPKIKK